MHAFYTLVFWILLLFASCLSLLNLKHLHLVTNIQIFENKNELTRVTPTSKSLLDHIVHIDCLTDLVFGVIKTNTTDHNATYFLLDITKTQSIRFQQTRATMPFLQNGYHDEKYLNYLRHCLSGTLKFRTGRR